MTGDGSEREEIETPLSPVFPSPITYATGVSSDVALPFPVPDVDPALTVPGNIRSKRLFPRSYATSSRSRPPKQCMAVTSSSSGGASSRANSRSRATRKSQGLHPVARKKNVSTSGPTRMGVRPVAKGTENVPFPMPIPIIVSDPEGIRKGVSGVEAAQTDAHTDAPSLNKKQRISSASLRKTSSFEPKTMPRPRFTAPRKPIQITRSTSSGMSASSSNVGVKKRVGFSGKSAVRATKVGSGGAGSANESGG